MIWLPAAICFSVVFARLETKVGCWLQLAVTVIGICLTDIGRLRWSTRSWREWMDPVLCMCQSILVQDAESQFAPDIHRSVCVCDERLVRLP